MKFTRPQQYVIWAITIVLFMESLDGTVLNNVLPVIARSLHDNPLDLKIALTSYLLSLGIFIPMSGWFADRVGQAKSMTLAIILFMIGSIGCGFSTSLTMLVFFRILQGIGGAFMLPTGRLVLVRVFPKNQLVDAMVRISSVNIIGLWMGPVLGGALATYLSWRLIFFINVPMGLIGILIIRKYFPSISRVKPRKFDYKGFILFAAALFSLLFVSDFIVNPIVSVPIKIGVFLLAIACAVLYVFHARRSPNALISKGLWQLSQYRYLALGSFVTRLSLAAIGFLIPLMLQAGYGWTAFQSGLLVMTVLVGAFVGKLFLKRLLLLFSQDRFLTINTLFCALFVGLLSILAFHFMLWFSIVLLLLFGFFRSAQNTTMNTSTYQTLPEKLTSEGMTVYSMIIQVSGSFAISLAAFVMTMLVGGRLSSHSIAPSNFTWVFVIEAVIPLFGCWLLAKGFSKLPADATSKPK